METGAHWTRAWAELKCVPKSGLWREVLSRYDEPHRAYHTLWHIEECIASFEAVRALAEHPAEIDLAIWFHDAFYDTKRTDNEERSAEWEQRELRASGADASVADRVAALVMATKSHQATIPDASLLLDIDLSILGADSGRFDEYEEQIRREYAWVAEVDYVAGRTRVLEGFRTRPAIYTTSWFADRLEARARENLNRSLVKLRALVQR
jgi:predicted metal-dependent HD superfamily phosphohydrolase